MSKGAWAIVAGASACAVALALGPWPSWLERLGGDQATALPAPVVAPQGPSAGASAALPASASLAQADRPASAASSASSAPEMPPAHWSMADAKIHGDERAPPIVRSLAAAPAPLTDHAAYAKQEKEADRRWKQAYAQAVDDQLPEMERLLARGQREGVPPEAIEKMQRKLQALRDARQQLGHELGAASAPVTTPRP